jgi:hypothetical protein
MGRDRQGDGSVRVTEHDLEYRPAACASCGAPLPDAGTKRHRRSSCRARPARAISPKQRRHAEMLQRLKPYYQDWYNAWLMTDKPQSFYVLNSHG